MDCYRWCQRPFRARGWMLRTPDRSREAFRVDHQKDLTEIGNCAWKVSLGRETLPYYKPSMKFVFTGSERRPVPAFPLFIFTTIPHPELPERKPFSFPILHTVPRFWRIPLPSIGQSLYPVSKYCVFPNLALYFGSNLGSRDNPFRPWIPYLQLFSHYHMLNKKIIAELAISKILSPVYHIFFFGEIPFLKLTT